MQSAMSPWMALRRKLSGGAVLRHRAGFYKPVFVGCDCPFHDHPTIEIVYHPTGRGMTTLSGGEEVQFAEGDVVVYAPQVRHDQRMTRDGIDCCVEIDPPAGLRLKGFVHIGGIDDVVLRGELDFLSSRSPGESSSGDALLNLRTTAAILALLEMAEVRATEAARPAERHVAAAERFIRNNYSTIGSVAEIAEAVGIGPDHLRHAFRKLRGRSLVGYLGEVRVARAGTLLTHTDLPIKEIARLNGYCDEYYFSAVFRRSTGVAPGNYRNLSRTTHRS